MLGVGLHSIFAEVPSFLVSSELLLIPFGEFRTSSFKLFGFRVSVSPVLKVLFLC